jgi:protein arginine kinase
MRSGLDFEDAFRQIESLDDAIDEKICYAFHPKYGYLTACPTNVGTGMRVSVMLHLPALVLTKQIEKVFRSLQKINLAVRGLYGEGSQAMGDFYQISNQITLGRSEYELIKQVGDVVPVIISYERKARHFLLQDSRDDLQKQVLKALATLQKAGQISSEETMHLLSKVRLGINLGLINDLDIPTVNRLFVYTQPAHLQKLRGSEMDTTQRNKARALYLHSQLELPSGDAPQS